MTIGDAIRNRGLDLELSQGELAARLGCNEMSIVNWELGCRTPQVAHLRQIIDFLGYNPFPEGANIAEKIVNFRKAQGISQKDFAAHLGIDQVTLARYERNERIPVGKYFSHISTFLRVHSGLNI